MESGEWVRDPQAGRSVVPVAVAARALRKHPETVQKEIRAGRLAGGRYTDKARWWVYVDADPAIQAVYGAKKRPTAAEPASEPAPPSDNEDELRRQLAARDAKLADRDETIRQLTTAAALEAERVNSAHRTNEKLVSLFEQILEALTESRTEAATSLRISAIYRDLIATQYIPDSPGDLS